MDSEAKPTNPEVSLDVPETNLPQSGEPQSPDPVPTSSIEPLPKPKRWPIIFAILVAVILLCIGAWFIFRERPLTTHDTSQPELVSGDSTFYFLQNNVVTKFDEKTLTLSSGSKVFDSYQNWCDKMYASPDSKWLFKFDCTPKTPEDTSDVTFKAYIAEASIDPQFTELTLPGLDYDNRYAYGIFSSNGKYLIFSNSKNSFIAYNLSDKSTKNIKVTFSQNENASNQKNSRAEIIAADDATNIIYWQEAVGLQSFAIADIRAVSMTDGTEVKLPNSEQMIKDVENLNQSAIVSSESKLFYPLTVAGKNEDGQSTSTLKVQSYNAKTGETSTIYNHGPIKIKSNQSPGSPNTPWSDTHEINVVLAGSDRQSVFVETKSTTTDTNNYSVNEYAIYRVGLNGGEPTKLFSRAPTSDIYAYDKVIFATQYGSLLEYVDCNVPDKNCSQDKRNESYTLKWVPLKGEAKTVLFKETKGNDFAVAKY